MKKLIMCREVGVSKWNQMENTKNLQIKIEDTSRTVITLIINRSRQKEFKLELKPIQQSQTGNTLSLEEPIKTSEELLTAIQKIESDYKCSFSYQELVNEVARLDWIIAAILAKKIGVGIPSIPQYKIFNKQNSLRAIKGVEIAVEWNYEWHHIKISFEKWIRLLSGEIQFKSTRYGVDGKLLTAYWTLNINNNPQISVPTCWEGGFSDVNSLKGQIKDSYDLALLTLESYEISESNNEVMTVTFVPQKRVNITELESSKDIFEKLVVAYEEWDDEGKKSLAKKIKDKEKKIRVDVDDVLQWIESQVDGYLQCPVVIQTINIFIGKELVCDLKREYGSEYIDPTHTGLGGRWTTIRIDEGGGDAVLEILSDFGHTVEEPSVPPWK